MVSQRTAYADVTYNNGYGPYFPERNLAIGDLVYRETIHAGMVPVKVLSFDHCTDGDGKPYVHVHFTATRKGYARGDTERVCRRRLVPRDKVYRTSRILGLRVAPYRWA